MKKILNKLINISIISLLGLITLLNIAGCKKQVDIEVTPVVNKITPVSEKTPIFISHPAQLPTIPTKTPPIPNKSPANSVKSVKTPQKTETYIFVKKWGSEGSKDGQFKNPSSIALDKEGNLYITDLGNYRIQKFDSNGKFLFKWGSQAIGKGKFKYFTGIAVDADNNIYVTENEDSARKTLRLLHGKEGEFYDIEGAEDENTIQKFSSDGKFITKWETKNPPIGILVSTDKKIYSVFFTDIFKYDSDCKVIKNWHIDLSAPIEERYPVMFICNIGIDSKNNIFVLTKRDFPATIDSSDQPHENFIIKINSDGNLIKKYKEIYDDKKEKLSDCTDIILDSEDNIFISGGHRRIWKFDSNLNFITNFGSEGELKNPGSIAVDSKGNVYVVDIGDFSIKKFAPEN